MEKEESLGRMAGAIAHHFNNLLFVILGNIELAQEDAPAHPALNRSLAFALDGTNRAAEISGRMLTYLGMNTRDKEVIDFSAACRQSLPLLLSIKPGAVAFETDFPSAGPTITANPSQVQEILAILAENAWESCEHDTCRIRLAISTVAAESIAGSHRFPLAWQPHSEAYACLEVADNGSGIDEEHIEKIFDPFFTNKFTGRGMGLAMVLGILRAHSGCVIVDSLPGRGSTFRVYLPLHAAEPR
jgi:signal transduction histidine kinase